jgi:hypothetical protein
MAKAEERTYEAAPDRVYSAAIKAIADLGYSVRSSDSPSRIVSFNTGMSWRSWSGQDMTVSVIEQAGGTRVTLTGGLAKKGTVITGGQLVAWGEKGTVSRRFLEALDRAVASTPDVDDAGPGGNNGTAAELQRLADLHRGGALTDSEFAAAKAKIIGA